MRSGQEPESSVTFVFNPVTTVLFSTSEARSPRLTPKSSLGGSTGSLPLGEKATTALLLMV